MDNHTRLTQLYKSAVEGRRRVVYIPDDEVDFRFEHRGISYSYSMGIPFGDLTVAEYYDYQTALREDALPLKSALKAAGLRIKPKKTLAALGAGRYRQLQAAVRLGGDMAGAVIECAGLSGRRDRRAVRLLMRSLRKCGYCAEVSFGRLARSRLFRTIGKRRLNKILAARRLEFVEIS